MRPEILRPYDGYETAAIGVGITYPLTCDIRYVAEDAKLQFAFVRRGVIPELSSHVILARVIGLSSAADLLLSGRRFHSREAAELRLASRALPAEDVLPAALERAEEIATHAAPVSVAISKRVLWQGLTGSVVEMGKREGPLFAWAGSHATRSAEALRIQSLGVAEVQAPPAQRR